VEGSQDVLSLLTPGMQSYSNTGILAYDAAYPYEQEKRPYANSQRFKFRLLSIPGIPAKPSYAGLLMPQFGPKSSLCLQSEQAPAHA
jgi:hypothetical protein